MSATPAASRAPVARMLSMIKFSHTVFALPFALLAAVLAAGRIPGARTSSLLLLAMVGARSAAMSFNRIVDREIDAKNPRTKTREIPSGAIPLSAAVLFCTVSAGVFVLAAALLSPLCLALSPVALLVVLGYSYTKRFTAASHLVLGLALAIAPVGAWIAVTGRLALLPVLLGLAVLLWVAGFDVLYSLQDEAFDRAAGLRSLAVRLGAHGALVAATLFHAAALALLYAVFVLARGGVLFGAGVVVAGVFLIRQHVLVSPKDLSRLDAAFFASNGWLSVGFAAAGILDTLIRR